MLLVVPFLGLIIKNRDNSAKGNRLKTQLIVL